MDRRQLPELNARPRPEALAICGGGFAGLFAAEVLARLEADLGRPLREVFDLIAGTSIGGLLALGLAYGTSAETLSALLARIGPELFGSPRLGLFKPKHDRAALVGGLRDLFAEASLENLDTRVIIPTVDITGCRTVMFGTDAGSSPKSVALIDVALATCAAPIFLEPHPVDDRLYADGGLAANSPEGLAAAHAVHVLGWPAETINLTVVGATQALARVPGHMIGAPWGASRWLHNQRLLTIAMRAQMTLARDLATMILGRDSVSIIDAELTGEEQRVIGLDRAGPRAVESLRTLASERYADFRMRNPMGFERMAHHHSEPWRV